MTEAAGLLNLSAWVGLPSGPSSPPRPPKMVMGGGGVFQHHQPRQGCGVLQGTSDSVQITFLVYGECAETRPFVGRRPTRPHTHSGNVECPVDWTHPVLYSSLLSWRGSIDGLTRHDRGGEANNWARAPAESMIHRIGESENRARFHFHSLAGTFT